MDLGLPDLFPSSSGTPGFAPKVKLTKGGGGGGLGGGIGGDLLSAAAGALGVSAAQPDPLTEALANLSIQLAAAPFVSICRMRFLPRSDFPGLAAGDEISVELGYGDSLTPVFAGSVATVAGRAGWLEVLASSKAAALARLRENSAYEQRGFADLLQTWAGEAELTPGDITQGQSYAYLAIDDRRSLWEWIARLARHSDVPAWVDAQGQLQAHASSGPPVASFKYGEDILMLDAAARDPVAGQATAVGEGSAGRQGSDAWAWLAKDAGGVSASAGGGAGAASMAQDGALRSPAAVTSAADGMAAGAQRLANTVRVSVPGNPQLDVASVFALEGCPGGQGDGSYAAIEVRHRFDTRSGFVTEVLGATL